LRLRQEVFAMNVERIMGDVEAWYTVLWEAQLSTPLRACDERLLVAGDG